MNIDNKSKGFIAIYRSILNWEWYDDLPTRVLFLDLLIRCNWKPKKWQGEVVNIGEIITSISHLSKSSGLTEKQVRTALKKLEMTNEITRQGASKWTKITINNFKSYQAVENFEGKQKAEEWQARGEQRASEGQAKGEQRATTKPSNQDNHDNHDNQENKETKITLSVFEKTVFEKYNSLEIIKHQEFTKQMRKALKDAKKNHSESEILLAIERYGLMYHDKENEYSKKYCNYKWTLKEILTRQKGISEFLDEGGKWLRYNGNHNTEYVENEIEETETLHKFMSSFHKDPEDWEEIKNNTSEKAFFNYQKSIFKNAYDHYKGQKRDIKEEWELFNKQKENDYEINKFSFCVGHLVDNERVKDLGQMEEFIKSRKWENYNEQFEADIERIIDYKKYNTPAI